MYFFGKVILTYFSRNYCSWNVTFTLIKTWRAFVHSWDVGPISLTSFARTLIEILSTKPTFCIFCHGSFNFAYSAYSACNLDSACCVYATSFLKYRMFHLFAWPFGLCRMFPPPACSLDANHNHSAFRNDDDVSDDDYDDVATSRRDITDYSHIGYNVKIDASLSSSMILDGAAERMARRERRRQSRQQYQTTTNT